MKKAMFFRKKGFTLIELLIVIALLGALAIGLLATIDPFEQLKKGRDTSVRNTVSEFYNANLRFYATRGNFAWPTSGTSNTLNNMTSSGDVIDQLVSAGELKNRFADLAGTGNLSKIYLNSTESTHMTVCFRPESKSFQIDLNTQYNSDGAIIASGCKSQTSTGGTDCFFCVQ